MAQTTGSPNMLTVKSLTLNGSGKLDLANNVMVVNYGSGVSPIENLVNSLKSGRNGGTWDGSGINSSIAAANSSYGLGIADDAAGQQVKVMYTLLGDTNLDGNVDVGDLGTLLNNYGQAGKIWSDGEFTYNASGAVDVGDLGLLLNNYGQATAALAATTSGVVSGAGITASDETAGMQLGDAGNSAVTAAIDDSMVSNGSVANAGNTLTTSKANEAITWTASAALTDGMALSGTQLTDTINPRVMDVVTVGGGGNDTLYGDAGANPLGGRDLMYGGMGADTFLARDGGTATLFEGAFADTETLDDLLGLRSSVLAISN
jgi:hypothetical protein